MRPDDRLQALFEPRSVAVVGASTSKLNLGRAQLRQLREFGYRGDLYAIHPSADSIEGVPAMPSIAHIPGGVDFAYVSLPAPAVKSLLADAAGHARVVQVVSGGFSEAGHPELEDELVELAHRGGMRLIGPNCLGTYSPAGGLTFIDSAPTSVGPTTLLTHSGGLATDVIRGGAVRGLTFNHVVTLGNSADVTMEELLDREADDRGTDQIGLYIESLRDGRAFADAVTRALPAKPIVALRGGLTRQGRRSGSSHTGAMATESRVWHGICRQLGLIEVESLDALVDTLVALQFRRHPAGRKLVILGPGGGMSVLATDAAVRAGYDLPPLDEETVAALTELGVGTGSSLLNPIDTPVAAMAVAGGEVVGEILKTVVDRERPDLVVVHLNLQNFVAYLDEGDAVVDRIVRSLTACASLPTQLSLCLRSNGEPELDGLKHGTTRVAAAAGLPVFGSVESALQAHARIARFEALFGRRPA